MFGVRAYARQVGLVSGLLTIAGMIVAAYRYDYRQAQKEIEVLPPENIDDRS